MRADSYSAEELAILKAVYPVGGCRSVHEQLPHRRLISIEVRASKLGLRSGVAIARDWSQAEDDALMVA